MENKDYPKYVETQILKIFEKENLKSLTNLKDYFPSQDNLINIYRKRYYKNFQDNVIDISTKKFILLDDETAEIQNDKIWKLSYDIKNCNDDLKLLVAQLYLFRPYINNPILEKSNFSGRMEFTYRQTFSDWNYSTFVSCCYEKLYNYWDRIGDILALYLKINIDERKVGFFTVINKIEKEEKYSNDENLIFLKNFKDNEFREFNEKRIEIVHYYQFETIYRHKYQKIQAENNKEEKMNALWEWKKNMPEYFKNHLELSLKGYQHCIKFINEHF